MRQCPTAVLGAASHDCSPHVKLVTWADVERGANAAGGFCQCASVLGIRLGPRPGSTGALSIKLS